MACRECGTEGAEPVRVEYVEATTETLQLCETCRERFEDGDFVTSVTPVGTGDGDDD